MEMSTSRVVVVGAGVTGAVTSALLRRSFGDRVAIEIWEKSGGVGGRMSTSRAATDSKLSCDLGAQYISATQEYARQHKSFYDELRSNDVITPLDGLVEGMKSSDAVHFVTPRGSNSIAKYFIGKSGGQLRTNTFVDNIAITNNKATVSAKITDNSRPHLSTADVVILTMPVPQILNLKGDIEPLLEPFRARLNRVSYSSRYALGCFYPCLRDLASVPWRAKYFTDSTRIRFVSIDSKKRNADPQHGLSVVAHASVPFSMEHLESSFEHVQSLLMDELRTLLPGLPSEKPITKPLRWRYSQVTKPYEGEPGCILLNTSPLVICAGDGFSHSNFDGCVESARSCLRAIQENLLWRK